LTDLSPTIVAKSDQLNADDLLGGPITIKIRRVAKADSDQPIAIFYEGDEGKPYLPCKSMRRVLVHVWGAKGESYVGKELTLFRDPKVKFGGIEVGGIRISHMTGITRETSMALTATRGSKKLYTVKPLKQLPSGGESAGADTATDGADGGDRDAPPADDFPGDKPWGSLAFTIVNSKGEARTTADGELWAATLETMFAKTATSREAQALWDQHMKHVEAASEAGFEALSTRVWNAASENGALP
jgi:hypothetical protein